jgi:glucose-6-phosphate 1-dehydrogenase
MVGRDVELIACRDLREGMLPYERLLGDALEGDPSLFASQKAVEAEWRVVGGVLGNTVPLHVYEPGTWGPREADGLMAGSGQWHNPEPPRASPGSAHS